MRSRRTSSRSSSSLGDGGSGAGGPAPEERSSLVRRTTLLLAGAQVALWGIVGVFAAFGAIVGPRLSGSEREVGILFGLYYVGTAAGARVAGRIMDRSGRRPGLAGGYMVMGLAGILAFVAVSGGSAAWLRISFTVLGLGTGAALLGRGAVADLYPPERRGWAVGVLVMAGTIGAIGGPQLGAAGAAVARALGAASPRAIPWLLGPALAAMALGLVLALRPDPRDLAVRGSAAPRPPRRPRQVLVTGGAPVAVVAIAVAQAVMVTFMSVIPAVLSSRGVGDLSVTVVVSVHLGAMFAFSPFLGSMLDTWGRRAGLGVGLGLLAAGVALGLAGSTALPGGVALLLIGVGWSAAYLASTAVVSDLTEPHERAAALGAMDLVAGLSAAVGVFGGALLVDAAGVPVLVAVALALMAVPVALVSMRRVATVAPTR